MTTTTADIAGSASYWVRERKAGVAYAALGLLTAIVFGSLATGGAKARFTFSEAASGGHVDIPAKPGAIAFGLIAFGVGAALIISASRRHFRWLTGVALASLLLSFLCWQVSGTFMPLVGIADGTVNLALPLIFGAIGGVLCERSGVINVAIEGQLITGAFMAAMFGTIFASVWVGLLAAAIGGALISLLLAVFAIRYLVDQVVLGVVLNLLALGLTGFLYERLMAPEADKYNAPPHFADWHIPGLAKIPVLGPVLFDSNIFVYLAAGFVVLVHVGLFHTRWGLRVRSVGEHPAAADTVGIRVGLTRYRNVLLAGVVAGIGGAYFTLAAVSQFNKEMTAGKGFIALAALIFGRWSPTGALLAALLFGFADQMQIYLSTIGSPIPSQFLSMAPYIATILAVAGLVGRIRAPAADGQPYVKG